MLSWKRAAALLLSMCMLLYLCACGSQNSGTGGESQETKQDAPDPSGTEDHAEMDESGGEAVLPTPYAQTISLQKQLYGLYDWDDDRLLVQSEYSHVTLWQEDAAKYPELAEVLEQTANMVKRSMEDEYDNLCATAREELPWAGETSVSTLDIQVRSATSLPTALAAATLPP